MGRLGTRMLALAPNGLARRLARSPYVRRRVLPVIRHHVRSGVVARGAAAGLVLDTDGTNPGYLMGAAEPQIQQIVAAVGPDDVFLDVGANIGSFSLIAARNGANVIAVEPHPRAAAIMRSNFDRNGLTAQILECALSDRRADGHIANQQHLTASLTESGIPIRLIPGDALDIDPRP